METPLEFDKEAVALLPASGKNLPSLSRRSVVDEQGDAKTELLRQVLRVFGREWLLAAGGARNQKIGFRAVRQIFFDGHATRAELPHFCGDIDNAPGGRLEFHPPVMDIGNE